MRFRDRLFRTEFFGCGAICVAMYLQHFVFSSNTAVNYVYTMSPLSRKMPRFRHDSSY